MLQYGPHTEQRLRITLPHGKSGDKQQVLVCFGLAR